MSVTTYDGPGKARKQCPNGHYVHARSNLCVCGHKFKEVAPQVPVETTVFDGPGKGRKECPTCQKYVGARTTSCVCGYVFGAKKKEGPEFKTYDDGGRGKKQCPTCNVYVGCRSTHCVCGHDFHAMPQQQQVCVNVVAADKEQEQEYRPPSLRERLGYPKFKYTLIPAGECPFKLKGIEESIIVDWINNVQGHYIAKSEVLAPSGFKYYAGHFFDVFSDDYQRAKRLIDKHFAQLLA
jgi:hypothetical protein